MDNTLEVSVEKNYTIDVSNRITPTIGLLSSTILLSTVSGINIFREGKTYDKLTSLASQQESIVDKINYFIKGFPEYLEKTAGLEKFWSYVFIASAGIATLCAMKVTADLILSQILVRGKTNYSFDFDKKQVKIETKVKDEKINSIQKYNKITEIDRQTIIEPDYGMLHIKTETESGGKTYNLKGKYDTKKLERLIKEGKII